MQVNWKRISRNRMWQHLLFWAFAFYVLLHLFAPESGELQKIDYIYTSIFLVTMAPGVYLHTLFLIPVLLSRKRYWLYGLGVVVLMAVTAVFNLFTFEKWIDYVLPGYYFISYYEFSDLLKFAGSFVCVAGLLKLARGWFMVSELNRALLLSQQEKTMAELKGLKSQMNPHFLFNSLNSIYSLALNRSEKTPEVILKLSDIMRYVLYEAADDLIDLSKEIAYLKDYIELQKLRSGRRAEISLTINGDPERVQIAPLLLLPLVENSFKHGVKGETGKTFVHMELSVSDGCIIFVVENNKGSTDNVEKDGGGGIGLVNVRKRLELLYPGRHELIIDDAQETFRVELMLKSE